MEDTKAVIKHVEYRGNGNYEINYHLVNAEGTYIAAYTTTVNLLAADDSNVVSMASMAIRRQLRELNRFERVCEMLEDAEVTILTPKENKHFAQGNSGTYTTPHDLKTFVVNKTAAILTEEMKEKE